MSLMRLLGELLTYRRGYLLKNLGVSGSENKINNSPRWAREISAYTESSSHSVCTQQQICIQQLHNDLHARVYHHTSPLEMELRASSYGTVRMQM